MCSLPRACLLLFSKHHEDCWWLMWRCYGADLDRPVEVEVEQVGSELLTLVPASISLIYYSCVKLTAHGPVLVGSLVSNEREHQLLNLLEILNVRVWFFFFFSLTPELLLCLILFYSVS